MVSFGPVPSRRLGKSLGINNILSPKVCSYGCVYCQVGHNVEKSISRESFFQPEYIYRKVEEHIKRLSSVHYPDYLAFVSNGEPTLDINLGKAIRLLKSIGIPIAVLTNGSLLYDEGVRNDLNNADWVSLKIDAGDNDTWQKVNRPSPELDFEKTIENIILFASEYKGILCTETMLVGGINDTINNITAVSEIVKTIKPVKAYLANPIRPPSDESVVPPDSEKMNRAWQIFNKNHIPTEFLTRFEGTDTGFTGNIYDDILNITAVHPLRQDSLIRLLRNNNADIKIVKSLIKQRLIRSTIYNGNKYYMREYHIQK
jgi:wyosine [tRNA(Phe)-imidazoG37] synthetase (radical SAM superfamily)